MSGLEALRRRLAPGWHPLRGSVVIERGPGTEYTSTCRPCGRVWRGSRTLLQEWRRWHLCPAGTVGAVPECPTCGSITKRCQRPPEWDVGVWHRARLDIYLEHTQVIP